MEKRQITGRFYESFCSQGRTGLTYAVLKALDGKSHRDIPKFGYIENWRALHYLKKASSGDLADFMDSNICGKICSPKLREIIDRNLTSSDVPIQWLPVNIEVEESGKICEYFYLHFPEVCDSLDEEETIFENFMGKPRVQVAHYLFDKIKNKSVFNCRDYEKSTLVISKGLRKAIQESKCTGLKFDQVIVLEEIESNPPSSSKVVSL